MFQDLSLSSSNAFMCLSSLSLIPMAEKLETEKRETEVRKT